MTKCGYCDGSASGFLRLNCEPICWTCWTERFPPLARIRAWMALARTIIWTAHRIATGRDSLHVLDPQGEARFTIYVRRDR